MPKKLIRRYLPDPEKIAKMKALGFLGHRLGDPSLWHLNRRSASGAMFWGLWCAFVPLPCQMVLGALAALAFRANLPLVIVLIWTNNPITLLPFIYLSYFVGSLLLGRPMPSGTELHGLLVYISERVEGLFHHVHYTQTGSGHPLAPFVLGALVTGLVAGSLGFVGMRLYWRWHVVTAWRKRPRHRT